MRNPGFDSLLVHKVFENLIVVDEEMTGAFGPSYGGRGVMEAREFVKLLARDRYPSTTPNFLGKACYGEQESRAAMGGGQLR